MNVDALAREVEDVWSDASLRKGQRARAAGRAVLEALDTGTIRVAERDPASSSEPSAPSVWRVHAWVKQGILLYFQNEEIEDFEAGPLHFRDKVPVKRDLAAAGVRVVPPGVARYGSFLEPGVILMPGYVNVGARVGRGSMVDTWATVGSCAQIGSGVHLSGGVGIGGVLEPPQAQPVIVEDHAFIGSRSIVVEGAIVEEGAVLGAGVVITASTPILDVTGAEPRVLKGRVPRRSVVIPGTWPRTFPAGTFQVPCALIIGTRRPSTDEKTSLENALREYDVAV
ncbi:MAG: 2,3,4,5-tetrahydropyridine-2,6-dicarboxylate N-succinyltransferase [Candidatus Eiseniibacteriota bacterium]